MEHDYTQVRRLRPHVQWIPGPPDDLKRDVRYRMSVSFLAHKGLIFVWILPEVTYFKRLRVGDLVWAAEVVTAELLPLVPVALACFPVAFRDATEAPLDLHQVAASLRRRNSSGPDWRNFKYTELLALMP